MESAPLHVVTREAGRTHVYHALLAALIAFLALTLLTLVDVRRGFLFSTYPVRTLFYVVTPVHGLMLVLGLAGMLVCYRGAARREDRTADTTRFVKGLAFAIFALLIVDLFTYRGVPAARSLATGRINAEWLQAFGVIGWKRPIAQATSYLFNVWHATMIGILISGLALSILPTLLKPNFRRAGFTGSLSGALFALPHPFCSCCSSVMAPSLVRRGVSTDFLLSFVIGAPMLNVTTLVLAVALLPAPFALTRIAGGVFVTIALTYLVARLSDRWDQPRPTSAMTRTAGWLDRIASAEPVVTPSQLLSAWLRASGRLALVLVPALWLWSVAAAAIFQFLPPTFGNNLPSVILAALGGTFFMISTWSEIPMALQLIESGIDGPAAALLVVLPPISLPCMMLLGGALRRFRIIALLSLAVMIAGVAAGAMFL
jgi:uncharacterized protein